MNNPKKKFSRYEVDGEEAVLFDGDEEVDRLDLNALVENFLNDNKDYQQKGA
jgi:hypothetical protein